MTAKANTDSMTTILTLPNGRTRPLNLGQTTRPGLSEIPVIDVELIFSDDVNDRKKVAINLREAASKVGFMYIKNHRVSQDLIEQIMHATEQFFQKSEAEKMQLNLAKNPDLYGYEGPYSNAGKGSKGDLKENFRIAYDTLYDPLGSSTVLPEKYRKVSLWPPNDADFKEKMLEYYSAMLTLARKLVCIFALALDLSENYFDHMVTHPIANLGILRYPPQLTSELEEVGNRAHSDIEAFTLLYQQHNLPALQILDDKGGWIWAEPLPGAFVLNIGDFLSRLTNDRWLSTVHRVVNNTSGQMRHSCGFFFGFNPEIVIDTLPSCLEDGEKSRYKPIAAGEYSKLRFSQGAERRVV